MSAYTIINVESIDRAVELAKACPIIGEGSIEFAEIHEVSMYVAPKGFILAGFQLADKDSIRNNIA